MSITDFFGTDRFLPGYPAFANEIVGTLAVHSQYVLHGNVRDVFLAEQRGQIVRPFDVTALLWEAMRVRGYECFICFDPVDGISVYPKSDPAALAAARELLGSHAIGRRATLERLRTHLAKVVGVSEQPPFDDHRTPQQSEEPAPSSQDPESPKIRAAFLIDSPARMIRVQGNLDENERDFFRYCQKLARAAQPLRHERAIGAVYNPVIWLADGERDLPAWFTPGVEPIRTVALGTPTLRERTRLARILAPGLPEFKSLDDKAGDRVAEEFAERTDGMSLNSMTKIARLSVDRGFPAQRIADAVRIYKLGVDDNPWQGVGEQIRREQHKLPEKVMGQPAAIDKTLDILKRAALGLSGAQATSSGSRPRGVLFFAGPTGVGKTELAKQIAKLLFGDVESYLRFDMSEFSAEHAADRLTGAPPGYVGFEAGGQLTGAVRRNPFQVLLFDEIEKAHRGVLDKFLQILEDGRLTDGQGVTTYFSECVIVFTSNLGIAGPETAGGEGQARYGEPYKVVEEKIRTAVQRHFTVDLRRPELLNRLGDNIVVFDYISAEAGAAICRSQMDNIVAAVERQRGIVVEFTQEAREALVAACTANLEHGGRGIGNCLESYLINPLARYVSDNDLPARARIEAPLALPELDGRRYSGGGR